MVWKSGWNRGINSSKFTLEVWLQASKADKPSNCFPALRDSTRCCQLKACGKRNEPIQSSAVDTSSSWNANATWLQKWNFKMKFQYDSPPQIPFLRKRVGIALRSSSPPQNVWTFCNCYPTETDRTVLDGSLARLRRWDSDIILHCETTNVFTQHTNLPLTVAYGG